MPVPIYLCSPLIGVPCSALFSSIIFSGVTVVMTSLVVNFKAPYSPAPISVSTQVRTHTDTL